MVMKFGIIFFSISSVLLPLFAITPITKSLGLVLPAVLLTRFLVGFGEGVALPSINNIMAKNIPLASRASAYGGMFTGFHSGNLVGLLLSPILIQQYGWRSLFYVFGAMGIPLLYIWSLVVPDPTREGVISKEDSTEPVSLIEMLRTRAVWAIITANIVNHWGYFIYLNWMPTYFYKVLGMDLRASSFMSIVPWLLMACGSLSSGIFCDSLVKSGRDRTAVRKMIQTLALMGAVPGLLMLSTGSLTVGQALFAMSMALGMTSLGQFTANISEVAPNHAGKLFGLSNTFGCISGIAGVSSTSCLPEISYEYVHSVYIFIACISFQFILNIAFCSCGIYRSKYRLV
jgi:ACS family sodium-dependent inorganic phosphate cotransporter/ACS family sodium-dependent inorganic phosphate cotransporter-like MFS transporter 9